MDCQRLTVGLSNTSASGSAGADDDARREWAAGPPNCTAGAASSDCLATELPSHAEHAQGAWMARPIALPAADARSAAIPQRARVRRRCQRSALPCHPDNAFAVIVYRDWLTQVDQYIPVLPFKGLFRPCVIAGIGQCPTSPLLRMAQQLPHGLESAPQEDA